MLICPDEPRALSTISSLFPTCIFMRVQKGENHEKATPVQQVIRSCFSKKMGSMDKPYLMFHQFLQSRRRYPHHHSTEKRGIFSLMRPTLHSWNHKIPAAEGDREHGQ